MKTTKIFKSLLLLILTTFLSLNAYSQQNLMTGYVVTLQGDTLHGLIDYPKWDKNPDKILFIQENQTSPTIYQPTQIKSFQVNDEIYVGAIVKTIITSRNTDDLQPDKEVTKIDTTFLQTIIEGPKSLYYCKNKFGIENFYIKQDGQYELLVYAKYLTGPEKKIRENKKYIGQLSVYFSNCPSLFAKIKLLKYSKESLKNIFVSYYHCTKTSYRFIKKKEGISIELGVLVGLSATSLTFQGTSLNEQYLTKISYPQSFDPALGFSLDLVLHRGLKRWSINNEFLHSQYEFAGDYQQPSYNTTTHIELDISYISMNNLIRYNYPIKNWFLYVNAGISNGSVTSATNYKRLENVLGVTEGSALSYIRQHEFGYILGVGGRLKKYTFEIRYKKADGITNTLDLSSTTKRYFVLLGYRF